MLAAVSRGCVNIVSSLLATGTDPNCCQEDGDPALLTAITHGHLQVNTNTHTNTLRGSFYSIVNLREKVECSEVRMSL